MLFKHLHSYGKFFSPDGDSGGGAGAGSGEGEGSDPNPGNEAGDGNEGGTQPPPKREEPSANQLIKAFAKERGITVEQLIDQFKSFEDANKTERERLEADLNRYKGEAEASTKELRDLRGRVALQDAVSALGNVYDAATVVDLALPLLEYGDDGTPANIEDALTTLKERRPRLFPAAAGSADGGKGGQPATTTDLNAALRSFMRDG